MCEFSEKFSAQDALVRLTEQSRKCLDNRGLVAMVLMGLFKAHDCLPRDHLKGQLHRSGIFFQNLHIFIGLRAISIFIPALNKKFIVIIINREASLVLVIYRESVYWCKIPSARGSI